MGQIQVKVNIKPYHTFGIQTFTKEFVKVKSLEELSKIPIENHQPIFILGGGSNVLFTNDFPGLIIKNEIKGIVYQEFEDQVLVKAGSGVIWDDFVQFCVESGWGGIENLSLIPGTVGASPIQNIGAYGVEICQTFVELTAFHLQTKEIHTFSNADCEFGYRDSVFKRHLKGQYFILDVSFKLSKNPILNLDYGAIKQELEKNNIQNPGIQDIRKVVCDIRSSKLPDPKIIGNAGSFFKNPEINNEKWIELKEKYPKMPAYPLENGNFKIAAGWLIEQAGWKGKNMGNAACHKDQALVLVNVEFKAKAEEIVHLANEIQKSVMETFGIEIIPEVNIL